MSKSPKNSRSASRPPVDAIQYEKLALSAFELVDRQIANLGKTGHACDLDIQKSGYYA